MQVSREYETRETMKLINNALDIGSPFGIPIRLHISLLIAAGIIMLLAAGAGVNILAVLILVLGLFGSVALHELGHSLVARAKGGYIHEIVLYPFGGAAKISNIPREPKDEILVALAGPAVSLVLAIIFWQIPWLYYFALVNLMLFLFNVLPVFPMDGGRVLRAGLTLKKGRLEATRIAVGVGKYFCILFIVIGLFGLYIPKWHIALPPNLLLAFIGGYIYLAGRTEYRQVLLEHQAQHFSGARDNHLDVDVSPPPYAEKGRAGGLLEKLRSLFRR